MPVPGQVQVPAQAASDDSLIDHGRHDAAAHGQADDHTPPQPHPTTAPTGRRRRAVGQPEPATATDARPQTQAGSVPAAAVPAQAQAPQVPAPVQIPAELPLPAQPLPGQPSPAAAPAAPVTPSAPVTPAAPIAPAAPVAPVVPGQAGAPAPVPPVGPLPAEAAAPATPTPGSGTPLPPEAPTGQPRVAQPLPAEAATNPPFDPNSTQGRAISVRTLGQGVPFTRQAAQVQQAQQVQQTQQAQQVQPIPQPTTTTHSTSATPAPHHPNGSGRAASWVRRDPAAGQEQAARPHPTAEQAAVPTGQPLPGQSMAGQSMAGQSRSAPGTEGAGRSYAIGAPDKNAAEGPEPLDGPGGAVEVADPPRPQPMDDELPPEPLDNPRRLLVWPAPDVSTQQALSDRGYRPVIVHSREEVDAQIAAFPAALFVDPLTGPITRTALQSLRQAAVAAEVPVLVTAGLGQATREAAYGADPAVLLKALAPRDSEQHPPRVLLIEEHAEIALALTATLERRGMQVARAASDADAVTLAGQLRPNLVVMDLMQVHRGQAGIVDWLRANQQLNRTPLVVYTAAVDQADLPRLASGETVLFLAERSTSAEVQVRIVDLLARIGTN